MSVYLYISSGKDSDASSIIQYVVGIGKYAKTKRDIPLPNAMQFEGRKKIF